jgi:hypothetical protein
MRNAIVVGAVVGGVIMFLLLRYSFCTPIDAVTGSS